MRHLATFDFVIKKGKKNQDFGPFHNELKTQKKTQKKSTLRLGVMGRLATIDVAIFGAVSLAVGAWNAKRRIQIYINIYIYIYIYVYIYLSPFDGGCQ